MASATYAVSYVSLKQLTPIGTQVRRFQTSYGMTESD
jgi:hypothetical protein